MTGLRRAALAAAMLMTAGAAWAEGGGHGAAPAAHGAAPPKPSSKRMTLPVSPVSLIEGSKSAWMVSDTDAGCYLISPSRKNSSRLAMGRHPELGLGLFAVNIGLSVPGPAQAEPVSVQTGSGVLAKQGRMVGAALLFMPLSQAELDQALGTLAEDGRLWLVIREAWLAHAGLDVPAAIQAFRKQCGGPAAAPAPVAPTSAALAPPAAGPVGSKSAAAP